MEILRDKRGSTTDSTGMPYTESFTLKEARRLQFYRQLASKDVQQPDINFFPVSKITNPLRRTGAFWTKK